MKATLIIVMALMSTLAFADRDLVRTKTVTTTASTFKTNIHLGLGVKIGKYERAVGTGPAGYAIGYWHSKTAREFCHSKGFNQAIGTDIDFVPYNQLVGKTIRLVRKDGIRKEIVPTNAVDLFTPHHMKNAALLITDKTGVVTLPDQCFENLLAIRLIKSVTCLKEL